MKVRSVEKINLELGDSSLPKGYVQLPVYDDIDPYSLDDLDFAGCSYVNAGDGYNFPAESTYSDYEYLKDELRLPFKHAYDLTDEQTVNMSYMSLYGYCDIVQSDEFEGLPLYSYTADQRTNINYVVLTTLALPMAKPILLRNMYVSKQLRQPLQYFQAYVDAAASVDAEQPKIKFLSYSAHDWTVAQDLLFLNADNYKHETLPFASYIMMELHSSDDCTSEACFWMEVFYNGVALEFSADCAEATACTYGEFLQMLQGKGFVNTTSAYADECATPFVIPTE